MDWSDSNGRRPQSCTMTHIDGVYCPQCGSSLDHADDALPHGVSGLGQRPPDLRLHPRHDIGKRIFTCVLEVRLLAVAVKHLHPTDTTAATTKGHAYIHQVEQNVTSSADPRTCTTITTTRGTTPAEQCTKLGCDSGCMSATWRLPPSSVRSATARASRCLAGPG